MGEDRSEHEGARPAGPRPARTDNRRQARLAAALRDNLARRKVQARERSPVREAETPGPDATDEREVRSEPAS